MLIETDGLEGERVMWRTKIFRFRDEATMKIARAKLEAWLARRKGRIQFEEIFVDNAYAVDYRSLRRII